MNWGGEKKGANETSHVDTGPFKRSKGGGMKGKRAKMG